MGIAALIGRHHSYGQENKDGGKGHHELPAPKAVGEPAGKRAAKAVSGAEQADANCTQRGGHPDVRRDQRRLSDHGLTQKGQNNLPN